MHPLYFKKKHTIEIADRKGCLLSTLSSTGSTKSQAQNKQTSKYKEAM
uniref:Uncharacterized protein n=1 Tax=Rhizophora mucronata TaxID=61149 RepID=A0A2P2LJV3_RHIMU